jgi:hypothetical protein
MHSYLCAYTTLYFGYEYFRLRFRTAIAAKIMEEVVCSHPQRYELGRHMYGGRHDLAVLEEDNFCAQIGHKKCRISW